MLTTPLRRRVGLLLLLCSLLSGCGDDGLVQLQGTVMLDGQPLRNATVHFIAQDPEGRDALGSTDDEGVFRLSTFEPDDGALPGNYKVTVRLVQPDTGARFATPAEAMSAPPQPQKISRPTLPPRYSHASQTVLEQQVPPEGNVTFELSRE